MSRELGDVTDRNHPSYKPGSYSRITNQQQKAIEVYANRIGEKIGLLVSEIIVESITMFWTGNQTLEQFMPLQLITSESDSHRLPNAKEVATRLKIIKSAVYRMMKQVENPVVRMRKAVRVRP